MRVYLDDERQAPDGWVRVRWPEEAIALLQTGQVEEISLDHDLGDDARGTGYTVILWIEEAVVATGFSPPKITVHTANPAARARMMAGVRSIAKQAAQRVLQDNLQREGFPVEKEFDRNTSLSNRIAIEQLRKAELYGRHPHLIPTMGDNAPPGWAGIVADALEEIIRIESTFSLRATISQIKSKFGTMRFYVRFDTGGGSTEKTPLQEEFLEQLRTVTRKAHKRSESTCEVCGAAGVARNVQGLISTACEAHSRVRPDDVIQLQLRF